MTAPAIDLSGQHVEDLRPVCSNSSHGDGVRPPAAFWLNQHGCNDHLTCTPCLANIQRWFAEYVAGGCVIECRYCKCHFSAFEEAFTVVPL